ATPFRRPAGDGVILDGPMRAIPGTRFWYVNRWSRDRGNGQQLMVYAGFDSSDPAQGVIVVIDPADSNGNAIPGVSQVEFFPTPRKDGPVRVVDATGQRLTVSAYGTGTFVFDVPTRTYVEPVGTLTPTPSSRTT